MSFTSSWVHSSLRHLTKKGHAQFLRQRGSIHEIQSGILQKLLQQSSATQWGRQHGLNAEWTYQMMAKRLPVSDWSHWDSWVEKQRQSSEDILATEIERYQPTSGSTQKRKWIPYTKSFLQEIDQASGVWMHDLYESYPGILEGRHYWSLSWLPEDLRSQMSNNDLDYFPWLKRKFLEQIMAVPDRVQSTATSEEARDWTIEFLVNCSDLSFLFVWSPTFLIGLCDDIWERRHDYSKLNGVSDKNEMIKRLWPKLALISAWDSADASPWANRLRAQFSVPLQGKGLFATEGVVTIPVQGRMHLAYQSHFYEFQRTDGVIVPSWEIKSGDKVVPLITTGSGLWRYYMGDELYVEEIYQGCPIMHFLGRKHTVDMVGEKLSFDVARDLMQTLGGGVVLLAIRGNENELSRYELVWEGSVPTGVGDKAENFLLQHHHYRLARELKQLDRLTVRHCEYSGSFFQALSSQMGWVLGDQKWEAIVRIPHPLKGF